MRTAFVVAGVALVAYVGYRLLATGGTTTVQPPVGPPQQGTAAAAAAAAAAKWLGANRPPTKVQAVIPPPLSVANQQKVLAAYAAHPELFPPGSKNYTALIQATTMTQGGLQ